MADYLNVEETSAPTLQLQMDGRHGIDAAGVQIEMSWSFVKEGSPDDDDVASNLSGLEELLDGIVGQDHEDQDDDDDDDGLVLMSFEIFMQEEGQDTIEVQVWSICCYGLFLSHAQA